MGLGNFVPKAWHKKLLLNLNDGHVYVDLLNRNYEGDIANEGDQVRINSIGRVTIGTYAKDSTSMTPETLQGSQQVLTITEAKYYDFEIDDIDKRQQVPKLMDEVMREAGWGLADVADAYVAAMLTDAVQSANIRNAAPAVGTDPANQDAYEILVDLAVLLDENNVPENGRWAVCPPWYHGLLLKDPRFVSFGTPDNKTTLKNGAVGNAAGFRIARSNNVPVNGSDYDLLVGYEGAATFAEQINEPEGFRPEGSFSDAVKGLHLYGGKVTRPYGLAKCVVAAA